MKEPTTPDNQDWQWLDEELYEFRTDIEMIQAGVGKDIDEVTGKAKAAIQAALLRARLRVFQEVQKGLYGGLRVENYVATQIQQLQAELGKLEAGGWGMTKNIMGYEMLPDARELNCDNGHKLCHCAGRAECHNCGTPLSDSYEAKPSSEGESNAA